MYDMPANDSLGFAVQRQETVPRNAWCLTKTPRLGHLHSIENRDSYTCCKEDESCDNRSGDMQLPLCASQKFVPAVKMQASVSAVFPLATVIQSAGSPLLSKSRCSALRIHVAPSGSGNGPHTERVSSGPKGVSHRKRGLAFCHSPRCRNETAPEF